MASCDSCGSLTDTVYSCSTCFAMLCRSCYQKHTCNKMAALSQLRARINALETKV